MNKSNATQELGKTLFFSKWIFLLPTNAINVLERNKKRKNINLISIATTVLCWTVSLEINDLTAARRRDIVIRFVETRTGGISRCAWLIVKSYESKINRQRERKLTASYLSRERIRFAWPVIELYHYARRAYSTEISPLVPDESLPRFIKQGSYRVYNFPHHVVSWRFFYAVAKLRIVARNFTSGLSFNITNYIMRRSLEMI